MHPKYWKFPGAAYRNADDGNGNQNPGGAPAPAADPAPAPAADPAPAPAADPAKPAPTDAEAKLLKEVMQKKEALVKTNADLAAAQARLAEFEGIDAGEIKKLLAEKRTAEEAALAAKGDFDTLKARMADEHTKAMASVKAENQSIVEQLAAARAQIEELSIGSQFAQSKFISDELTLTAPKARTIYGAHFDTVDGSVVAYDKPRGAAGRTPLVDQFGSNVGFEDALRRIVDADPDKDSLLRAKTRPGAGSNSQPTRTAPPPSKANDPASKIAAGMASLNLMAQKSM